MPSDQRATRPLDRTPIETHVRVVDVATAATHNSNVSVCVDITTSANLSITVSVRVTILATTAKRGTPLRLRSDILRGTSAHGASAATSSLDAATAHVVPIPTVAITAHVLSIPITICTTGTVNPYCAAHLHGACIHISVAIATAAHAGPAFFGRGGAGLLSSAGHAAIGTPENRIVEKGFFVDRNAVDLKQNIIVANN